MWINSKHANANTSNECRRRSLIYGSRLLRNILGSRKLKLKRVSAFFSWIFIHLEFDASNGEEESWVWSPRHQRESFASDRINKTSMNKINRNLVSIILVVRNHKKAKTWFKFKSLMRIKNNWFVQKLFSQSQESNQVPEKLLWLALRPPWTIRPQS